MSDTRPVQAKVCRMDNLTDLHAQYMSGLWFWKNPEQRPKAVGDGWTQAERLSGHAQVRQNG